MNTRNLSQAFAVATLAAVFGTQAHAVIRQGWERPVQKAEMKIIETGGVFAEAKDVVLVMTRQDGTESAEPTGFVLTIDGQSRFFKIAQIADAGCGSKEYAAYDTENQVVRMENGAVLKLVDHTKRICLDFKPYRWEASVTRVHATQNGPEMSTLKAVGNPEGVYTIQNAVF